MTNYIEVEHEYDDSQPGTGYISKEREIFFAVRPVAGAYKTYKIDEEEPDWKDYGTMPWRVNAGEPILIYNQHDIDGLRKLLDAIEAELDKE